MRIAQPSPFTSPGGTPAQEPPPQPPSPPPRRKHGGGHPPASPKVARAVLAALEAGENASEAARRGAKAAGTAKLSRMAVRGIWERAGNTWPPPGVISPPPPRPAKVTPAQVRQALGARQANGRWEHSVDSVAEQLGVSRSAVYRALRRAKTSSEERQSYPTAATRRAKP